MKIAIVDDDGRFRAQTARSLVDILEKKGYEIEVGKYASAEALLAVLDQGERFALYFLDIVMPGMDGMTLARALRARGETAPILFFTTSREYAVEAFALGAAHYVVKPFTRGEFTTAIERALGQVSQTGVKKIVFRLGGGVRSVSPEDIVSSESDEHYQHVFLADGSSFFTRMSGQELWEILERKGAFFRAGLKYILNLSHVTGVNKAEVTLKGSRTITVPRRTVSDLRGAYLAFCCR